MKKRFFFVFSLVLFVLFMGCATTYKPLSRAPTAIFVATIDTTFESQTLLYQPAPTSGQVPLMAAVARLPVAAAQDVMNQSRRRSLNRQAHSALMEVAVRDHAGSIPVGYNLGVLEVAHSLFQRDMMGAGRHQYNATGIVVLLPSN